MFITCGVAYNHESPRRGLNFVTQRLVQGVREFLRSGKPIKMGNPHARRDWHHAKDTVQGMYLAMHYDNVPYDFTFASGEEMSVEEFAVAVCKYYGVMYDYHVFPSTAGYDFSTYSIGQYDDDFTDFFFENYNSRFYLNVWSDTDIQDMGYSNSLDEISVAPESGWSPSRYTEAIEGHTYVIWTWDDHYAKVLVKSITSNSVVFDWAYQTATGNPELKRAPLTGGRKLNKRVAAKQ